MRTKDHLCRAQEQLPLEFLRWFWLFQDEERTRLVEPRCCRRVLDFLVFQHRQGLPVSAFSSQLLVDYLSGLDSELSKRSTRLAYRSNLRRWLRFLYRQHVLLYPWDEEVDSRCGGEKRTLQPLTYPEVKSIFQTLDLRTTVGLQFRAMLELLYGCALRRGELAALNLGDIDLQERTVYVRCSKNGTGRALPITSAATRFLLRYLLEVRAIYCQEHSDDAFFLGNDGKRFHPDLLVQQMRRWGAPRFHLHQLRHSCATHLLIAGVDVVHIKVFLGHRHLSSTQVYTHLTPSELQRIHARCHPANHY